MEQDDGGARAHHAEWVGPRSSHRSGDNGNPCGPSAWALIEKAFL